MELRQNKRLIKDDYYCHELYNFLRKKIKIFGFIVKPYIQW